MAAKPAPKPKARAAPKKTVKARVATAAASVVKALSPRKSAPKKPDAAVDDTVSVLEKLSITENETAKPVAAKKAPAPKKAPAKKPAAKKAPAKKAPAKKKKSYDSDDSDDFCGSDSDSDIEVVAPVPARARSGRAAAKKITYVIDDSDDESFDEDSDF